MTFRALLCATIAVAAVLLSSRVDAGYILTASGNDKHANVLAAITSYNSTNAPDLPTVFTQLSLKSDDSGGFAALTSAGFSFFSNAAGTTPITTAGQLHSEVASYFTYAGVTPLLYYSVKASNKFQLYTYEPGVVNLLHPQGPPGVSHVTFWSGNYPGNIETASTPEPASMALLAMGGGLLAFGRKRLSRQKPMADRTASPVGR